MMTSASALRQRLLLLLEHEEPAVRAYAAGALAAERGRAGPVDRLPRAQRNAVETGLRELSVVVQERAEAVAGTPPGQLTQVFAIIREVLERLLADLTPFDPEATGSAAREDPSETERQAEAIALWVRTVWSRSTDQERRRIIESLDDAQDRAAEALGIEELRRRNALRVNQLYAHIEDESYSAEDLDVSPGQEVLVIQLPGRAEPVYPQWQFDNRRRPWPWMVDVMTIARQNDLDAVSLHRAMVRSDPLHGSSPLELAHAGRLDLVRERLSTVGEMGG